MGGRKEWKMGIVKCQRILAKKEPCFLNANNRHARRDVSSPFAYDLENASFNLKHFSLSQSNHSISSSPSQIVSKPANHFRLCHYHSSSYILRILAFLIYNYNHSYLYVRWCYWDIHKELNIAKVLVFNSLEGFHFLGCGCLIIQND